MLYSADKNWSLVGPTETSGLHVWKNVEYAIFSRWSWKKSREVWSVASSRIRRCWPAAGHRLLQTSWNISCNAKRHFGAGWDIWANFGPSNSLRAFMTGASKGATWRAGALISVWPLLLRGSGAGDVGAADYSWNSSRKTAILSRSLERQQLAMETA